METKNNIEFSKYRILEYIKKNDLLVFFPLSLVILFSIIKYIGFFQLKIYPTINRATMTKFGIKVAELTVMFVKD